MSTSLLYHAFGVRGYRYLKTGYVGGEVIFTIEQPWETCRCSACGSENVDWTRKKSSSLSYRADRRQTGIPGVAHPPRGVS